MKKSILILAAFISANIASAQTIGVTEEMTTFSNGNHNALVVTVFYNSKDDVISKWKSYLKDLKNDKVKVEKDELFADNVLLKDWGNNTVDIYSHVTENTSDKTVKLYSAFDLTGAYLSSASDAAKYALTAKMLKDFAVQASRSVYDEKIKVALKILSDLENDQKNLEKENKNLHDDIETYKNKITKAEEDIRKNEADQAKKKSEQQEQKANMELLKRQMEGVN